LFLLPYTKRKIESFVVRNIKENLLATNLEIELQRIIEKQLAARHTGKDLSLDRIEKSLSNNKAQMDNIVDAIIKESKWIQSLKEYST